MLQLRACTWLLGISLFAPLSSFNLLIDLLDATWPGAQGPVKASIAYEVTFVAVQLACHFADARLPISRAARIELRHICVVTLLAGAIAWLKCLVGEGSPPLWVLNILLLIITACGAMDGLSIGAVFGEAAILGPCAAHAVVAGTAAVLPLLATIRVALKAVMPQTMHGLRMSVVVYLAVAAAVALAGLCSYVFVVLPAVAAVAARAHGASLDERLEEELGIVPLVPFVTLGSAPLDGDAGAGKDAAASAGKDAAKGAGSFLSHSFHPTLSVMAPSSIRGTSLLVRRAHTHLAPAELRLGTLAGATQVIARRTGGHLESTATAPAPMRSLLWPLDSLQPRAHASCGELPPTIPAAIQEDVSLEEGSAPPAPLAGGAKPLQTRDSSPFAAMAASPLRPARSTRRSLSTRGSSLPCRSTQLPSLSSLQWHAALQAGKEESATESLVIKARASECAVPMFGGEGVSTWAANWRCLRWNWRWVVATQATYAVSYLINPAVFALVSDDRLQSWYSLLLVTAYGFGDLAGKLLPLWHPRRPQATVLALAAARGAVFIPLYALGLAFGGPAGLFLPSAFLLAFSSFYEAMIFAHACTGLHPHDAYMTESMLAIQLDVGITLGSVASLAWAAGPWAATAGASGSAHG